MNKKHLLFLFLSFAVLWTGCTEEDLSNCPTGFWLTFVPENSKHNYAQVVENLDLYFYDSQDNSLIKKLTYARNQLRVIDGAAYVSQDSIPAGNYRVMALVNDGSHTDTRDAEVYDRAHTSVLLTEIDYHPVTLFSGETDLEVERFLAIEGEQEFPIYLYKHNNLIRVNIYYDKDYEMPAGTSVKTYVHGSNGRYHHTVRSRPAESNPDLDALHAHYLPFDRFERVDPVEGTVSEIYMSTMHMWHGGDINLRIYEERPSGTRAEIVDPTRAYDLDLTDLLRKVTRAQINGETVENPYNTDDKLRFHDEYEIWVRFGKTSISTKVGLDDWAKVGDDAVEL